MGKAQRKQIVSRLEAIEACEQAIREISDFDTLMARARAVLNMAREAETERLAVEARLIARNEEIKGLEKDIGDLEAEIAELPDRVVTLADRVLGREDVRNESLALYELRRALDDLR